MPESYFRLRARDKADTLNAASAVSGRPPQLLEKDIERDRHDPFRQQPTLKKAGCQGVRLLVLVRLGPCCAFRIAAWLAPRLQRRHRSLEGI